MAAAATGLSSAHYIQDGVDWSKSHRVPPPIPHHPPPAIPGQSDHKPAIADGIEVVGVTPGRRQSESRPNENVQVQVQVKNSTGGAGGAATRAINGGGRGSDEAASSRVSTEGSRSQRPRRGSFNFLRRTKTENQQSQQPAQPNGNGNTRRPSESGAREAYYTDATPLPQDRTKFVSRIAQASEQGAERRMLRKSSKLKKAEEERLAREAAIPRGPPNLPSLTLGKAIASFDDAERPDSIAIFNNAYTTNTSGTSPPTAARNTNFSRPGMASSSSPAYTSRFANPPSSSSPPASEQKVRINGGGGGSGEYVSSQDPNQRADSMANRGRYSYASSTANVNSVYSPRRVRRRKDPTPFNILVIGAKNSGKTSFISFLKHSLALPSHKQPTNGQPESETAGHRSSFTFTYLETEIDAERVGVTLWDSAGLEKGIVDLQLREMTAFVESKFEDTFAEEQKVMRTPGAKDTHIHCVFLILDPVRLDTTIAGSAAFHKKGQHTGSLDDDLDLQVMRALWGKTTVIPIVSKADTLTCGHMSFLKRAVWEALKGAKLDPLEALELEPDEEGDEDEDDANGVDSASESDSSLPVPKTRKSHKRQSSLSAINSSVDNEETPYIPMSIISPDPYDLPPYVSKARSADKVGRRFPWGFASPYDPDHCDFNRLRDSVFTEWRAELRELSRSRWYENWRTSRLKNLPGSKQRVKGGVTPLAAVPKHGRAFSPNDVPRSVSGLSNVASVADSSNAVGPRMDVEAKRVAS